MFIPMAARRLLAGLLFIGVGMLLAGTARAQLPGPGTYSDYYSRELRDYSTPSLNPSKFTYDRMFYRSPAVSPYSNLLRTDNPLTSTPNYYRYVLPEEQRRQQLDTRLSDPRAGGGLGTLPPISSGGLPGAYQNHWYGSRQAMGLGPR
jgi:hypothetical protein